MAGYPYGTSAPAHRTRTKLILRTVRSFIIILFYRLSLFEYELNLSSYRRNTSSNNWCRVQFVIRADSSRSTPSTRVPRLIAFAVASLFGAIALGLAFIATVVAAILIVVTAGVFVALLLAFAAAVVLAVLVVFSRFVARLVLLFRIVRLHAYAAPPVLTRPNGVNSRREYPTPRPFESRGIDLEYRGTRRDHRRRSRANPRRSRAPVRIARGGPHARDITGPDPAPTASRVQPRHRAHRTPEPDPRRCRCRSDSRRDAANAGDLRCVRRRKRVPRSARSRNV